MNKESGTTFIRLFKEAHQKFFGDELKSPLSESASKLFCIAIQEKTGLVLGFKSIKNYSIFILGGSTPKKENPSLATLDTLARYVLNAPATTEQDRKRDEDHYPYWHLYKKSKSSATKSYLKAALLGSAALVAVMLLWLTLSSKEASYTFSDDFSELENMESRGWILVDKNQPYWERRSEEVGFLKLFTLEGDNWPDSASSALGIRNLLVLPVNASCFDAEVSLRSFIPQERWQQAGFILLEDTAFAGKVLRLSLGYNDFYGGFERSPEMIVQGVTSQGFDNPEEMLHHTIFEYESTPGELLKSNLLFSALRIEKRGPAFRFLLAIGSSRNAAFKELGAHEFSMRPKYVGIFALKGNVEETAVMPVLFDSFKLKGMECEE